MVNAAKNFDILVRAYIIILIVRQNYFSADSFRAILEVCQITA